MSGLHEVALTCHEFFLVRLGEARGSGRPGSARLGTARCKVANNARIERHVLSCCSAWDTAAVLLSQVHSGGGGVGGGRSLFEPPSTLLLRVDPFIIAIVGQRLSGAWQARRRALGVPQVE